MGTAAETVLLKRAAEAFRAETGLTIKVLKQAFEDKGRVIDGLVELPNRAGRLAVEVKKWAQHANIGALAHQVKALPTEGMLVADYVNPNMAERLRALGIQFIDAAGNTYIHRPALHIWVAGKRPATAPKAPREGGNRAFEATGLRVVYGLLCLPELVNAPYREIAQYADVALGTVGQVIQGLKAAGFLREKGKGRDRRLVNQQKLFDRWVEAYPEKLQPKLKVGEFTTDDPLWWQKIDIEKFGACWGGEIAATKYTYYLKPKVATVYLPEQAGNKLFAAAKLRKTVNPAYDENLVLLYRPFWQVNEDKQQLDKEHGLPGLVHPILVYADLIASGDARNMEAAKDLYERYIAEYLREA